MADNKLDQKDILPEEESESKLATDILDSREDNSKAGRRGQNPFLNLLAMILIIVGIATLIMLYLFFFARQ